MLRDASRFNAKIQTQPIQYISIGNIPLLIRYFRQGGSMDARFAGHLF